MKYIFVEKFLWLVVSLSAVILVVSPAHSQTWVSIFLSAYSNIEHKTHNDVSSSYVLVVAHASSVASGQSIDELPAHLGKSVAVPFELVVVVLVVVFVVGKYKYF